VDLQRQHPIETFDPLLRDLVGWGLVERSEEGTGTGWQLVPAAQQRLDDLLAPSGATGTGTGADVYLNRLCADCHQRGLTRLRGECYLCDRCWTVREDGPVEEVTEPSPVTQAHFWRRPRHRQSTPLAS
jgi:hypothetical protein